MIRTKFHGPTNYRGSRVIADDGEGNRVTLSWWARLDSYENHKRAAVALAEKLGWSTNLAGSWFKANMFWWRET